MSTPKVVRMFVDTTPVEVLLLYCVVHQRLGRIKRMNPKRISRRRCSNGGPETQSINDHFICMFVCEWNASNSHQSNDEA